MPPAIAPIARMLRTCSPIDTELSTSATPSGSTGIATRFFGASSSASAGLAPPTRITIAVAAFILRLQRREDLREPGVAADAAVVVAEEPVEEVAAGVEVVETVDQVVRARGRVEARRVLADELVLLAAVLEVLHRDARVH